ncbi:AAA family ATPase [soil metagenome]
MKRYPNGSEWRKWDLHVHVPGTKLSDGYEAKNDKPDWDRFADALENSDVFVFGITDFFCATETLTFIQHFKNRYPNSAKLLLVNLELRLNETVNGDKQMVDFHIIFRDSVPDQKIQEYITKLKTQFTDTHGREKACSELSSNSDYASASITRAAIKDAFDETFGAKAEPTDYLIYVAPSNNNGLRAERGNQRKANLADEIDKVVHAIFGKSQDNATYYLKTNRFADKSQISKPKPVFGGCDAHSFEQLEKWLGKSVDDQTTRQVITWVKADPTFEGLHQILVEPSDRVALSDLKPDDKDLYKLIKKVTFSGSTHFPEEIVFNPNLNAIIGSRSSGKSALLAHIAYSVDPAYTIRQQVLATKIKESEVGPAAGLSWKSVESTICNVVWGDGTSGGGSVIYIPQNWLYQISDNPKEVTDKIRPVIESRYGTFFREHERLIGSIKLSNEAIEKSVGKWFELAAELERISSEIKQVGDKQAITKARDTVKDQIEELRKASQLSAEDLRNYQTVSNDIASKRARVQEITVEIEQIQPYIALSSDHTFTSSPGSVVVEINLTPDPSSVPDDLSAPLASLIEDSEKVLIGKVEAAVLAFRVGLKEQAESLEKAITKLETDNKDLLEKHKANATLDELVKRQKAQQDFLDKIERLEVKRNLSSADQETVADQVDKSVISRNNLIESLVNSFNSEPRKLDQLAFGIAIDFDDDARRVLSEPFRKSEKGTFLASLGESDQTVDIQKAQGNPKAFMHDLFSKAQKLNQGNNPLEVSKRILGATPEIRFTAELDSDRIGGFERSTMTPGKQALFALTLILGEAEERWVLLIDQPEDDLDSRSIYGDIVKYLAKQKKQRQIILVTHNANLVIGSDAEEVIVANRHGDDRRNKDGRTFDYLSGSLEHTQPKSDAPHDLECMGIREHAVEILDGGEEAFQKRRDKYKI